MELRNEDELCTDYGTRLPPGRTDLAHRLKVNERGKWGEVFIGQVIVRRKIISFATLHKCFLQTQIRKLPTRKNLSK